MKTEKTNNKRREFIKQAVLLLGIGTTAPLLSSSILGCKDNNVTPSTNILEYNIPMMEYPGLAVAGNIIRCKATLSTDTNKTISIIVRVLKNEKFIIVQHNCTHQADQELPAKFNSQQHIVCPRHHAEFSMLENEPGKLVANPNDVNASNLKVYNYEYKKKEGLIVLLINQEE